MTIAILFALPFYFMVTLALKSKPEAIRVPPTLWPQEPTLANLPALFDHVSFGQYLINGVVYASATTLGVTLTGVLAAYVFARIQFRGREALFLVILGMMMIPPEVVAIPDYLIIQRMGLYDSYLGLVLPILAWPFSVFVLRQAIRSLPRELFEAAVIDGAGHVTVLRRIAVPLVWPSVTVVAFLAFVRSWNDLLWPLLVTPDEAHRTPQVAMLALSQQLTLLPELAMASTLVVLPVVALFLLMQRRILSNFAWTGLK